MPSDVRTPPAASAARAAPLTVRALAAVEALAPLAVALLPPALLYTRAGADALLSLVGALFVLRSALARDWAWTREAWVRVAAALWLWLLAVTLAEGNAKAVNQAVVLLRLPLFVAACAAWALAEPAARRWIAGSFAVCAGWLVLECWQQLLFGANLFGHPRDADGALTGPFLKPRAGPVFLALFFPAVLPPAVRWLGRGQWVRALGLLALACVTMVLIGQRMPTLLMVFGLLIAALLLPRLRLAAAAALLLGAALLAATPIVSPPTFQKLVLHFLAQMQHFWTSDYGQLFMRAMAMLGAHPLAGLGMNGFRDHCLEPAYVHGAAWLGVADGQVLADRGCNIHPHNYWLEMATAGGLPALAGFAALVALWLRALLRGLRPAAQPERAALLVAVAVALWPLASTSSLFVIDAGGWVFVLLGWGLAEAAAAGRAEAATAG
jgi:O-antigen ligase